MKVVLPSTLVGRICEGYVPTREDLDAYRGWAVQLYLRGVVDGHGHAHRCAWIDRQERLMAEREAKG